MRHIGWKEKHLTLLDGDPLSGTMVRDILFHRSFELIEEELFVYLNIEIKSAVQ
jgi:hypothetical protein